MTGGQITVTLYVADPCIGATDAKLEPIAISHYQSIGRTTYIEWKPFTFGNYKCNDGTIPFPYAYTSTTDAQLP